MNLNLSQSAGRTMNSQSRVHTQAQAISTEQVDRIITAIVDGKYSWACLLMLQCFGYNPLHYIPYRTYNRLMKENRQLEKLDKQKTPNLTTNNQHSKFNSTSSQQCLSKITDLAYLDAITETKSQVRGGLSNKNQNHNSDKFKLLQCLTQKFSFRT